MEFKNAKNKKFWFRVQSKITNCVNCQPFDSGEPIWILGDRVALSDLLYELHIPESSWDTIVNEIVCPYCGNDSFDTCSDVGIETEFDRDVNKNLAKAEMLYGKEVKALEDYIVKYPLLAYSQKFGKKIYSELKKKNIPVTSVGGVFFRSRISDSDEIIENIPKPPQGKSLEGRFNHAGQSHLYLSSTQTTSMKEVIGTKTKALVWCQKYHIEKIDNILDLSFDWSHLSPSTSILLLSLKVSKAIEREENNVEFWRPDYFLTRYIMDCAKELKYNGIKYNSVKDSFDYDLVLFYPDVLNVKPSCEPEIHLMDTRKESTPDYINDL